MEHGYGGRVTDVLDDGDIAAVVGGIVAGAIGGSPLQVSGPAVTLTGADTSGPTFTAPYAGTNGAAGVIPAVLRYYEKIGRAHV